METDEHLSEGDNQPEALESDISYARSSDFNPLIYSPITSKKMPKFWFPDVYPKYARSYHTPSSPQPVSSQAAGFLDNQEYREDEEYVHAAITWLHK